MYSQIGCGHSMCIDCGKKVFRHERKMHEGSYAYNLLRTVALRPQIEPAKISARDLRSSSVINLPNEVLIQITPPTEIASILNIA